VIAPKGISVARSSCRAPRHPIRRATRCAAQYPGRHDRALRGDDARQRRADLALRRGRTSRVLRREGSYAQLRLRSVRSARFILDCRATIGEVGNEEHNLESIGKRAASAGAAYARPYGGVAMNPIDHPHGGGEGRTVRAAPDFALGVQSKGYKTRRNKRTQVMIVRDAPGIGKAEVATLIKKGPSWPPSDERRCARRGSNDKAADQTWSRRSTSSGLRSG